MQGMTDFAILYMTNENSNLLHYTQSENVCGYMRDKALQDILLYSGLVVFSGVKTIKIHLGF